MLELHQLVRYFGSRAIVHIRTVGMALFLLTASPFVNAAESLESDSGPSSTITAVRVYSGWARVTRTITVDTQQRFFSVDIDGLPIWIDIDSVHARIDNGTVLDVHARIEHSTMTKQRINDAEKAVEETRKKAQIDHAAIARRLDVLATERSNLEKLVAWKVAAVDGEKESRQITEAELNAMTALTQNLRNNAEAQLTLQAQSREIDGTIADAQKALDELRKEVKAHGHISVDGAAESDRVTVHVDYSIPGATWFPSYQLSETQQAMIPLKRGVAISQVTGEDWSNAVVSANLKQVPKPLFALQATLKTITADDDDMRRAMDRYNRHRDQAKSTWLEAHHMGLTGQYATVSAATIPSDATLVRIDIDTVALPVKRQYDIFLPREQRAAVYGDLQNPLTTAIIGGRLTVNTVPDEVTTLPSILPGAKTKVFLGYENALTARRETDVAASAVTSMGDTEQLDLGYRVVTTNQLKRPVLVTVTDLLPASDVALLPGNELIHRNDRSIRWTRSINPASTLTTSYQFRWRYPRQTPPGLAQLLAMPLEHD